MIVIVSASAYLRTEKIGYSRGADAEFSTNLKIYKGIMMNSRSSRKKITLVHRCLVLLADACWCDDEISKTSIPVSASPLKKLPMFHLTQSKPFSTPRKKNAFFCLVYQKLTIVVIIITCVQAYWCCWTQNMSPPWQDQLYMDPRLRLIISAAAGLCSGLVATEHALHCAFFSLSPPRASPTARPSIVLHIHCTLGSLLSHQHPR